MTVAEMIQYFKVEVDKSNSLEYADFTTEEILYWLNRAVIRTIKQRMFGNNPKKEGFESSQKRIDDLRVLVTRLSISASVAGTFTNSVKADLPITNSTKPYLFYIDSFTTVGGNIYQNELISHDLVIKFAETATNRPWINNPKVIIEEDNIEIFLDPDIADTYNYGVSGGADGDYTFNVTYLKKPKTLVTVIAGTYETTECELPEYIHEEIVLEAANLALENIESQRVQTGQITKATEE